jgi:hypothetical protein
VASFLQTQVMRMIVRNEGWMGVAVLMKGLQRWQGGGGGSLHSLHA